jgi:sugar lactone lactonase YvrE
MSIASRRLIIATAALVLCVAGGSALWRPWEKPRPTAFGWPAQMTTVAGTGERGSGDGPGAAVRFSDPFAVAIDATGALYIADAGETNRIRKIAADGRTTTLPGTFDTPSGLAVDRAGNVYVADTGANLIRRIGRDGTVTIVAGDGTAGFRDGPAGQAQFNGPIGVAVDPTGNIYVADTYNDRIRQISPDGQVKTVAGGNAPGFADGTGGGAAFDTPCGLAIAPDGALLIADTGNDAIRRMSRDGAVTTPARAGPQDDHPLLATPIGLAVTPDGYLYITTFFSGRILEMAPDGRLMALTGRDAGLPGNQVIRLARPAGVVVDRKGALYVAEAAAYAIRKLAPVNSGGTGPVQTAALAVSAPAALHAATFPWPVKPQWARHEVVGDMGEVRGDYKGESRDHLHGGLDVRANVGDVVLAVADEKVEGPLPNWGPESLSEGLHIDQFTYIHMRVGRTPDGSPLDPAHFGFVRDAAGKLIAVRVKRGTRFHVGDPLGTVNRMAHVHLELGARGGDANPMALKFAGLTDHIAPHISGIEIFDAAGRPLTERQGGRLVVPRGGGPLSIVVDAWDQVDGDEARRRLGLYRAGYQIIKADGSPVKGFEQPRVDIVFDRLPRDPDATKIAYAPSSGDTVHGAAETRFLYVVTNRVSGGRAETAGWRPDDLPAGDYIVRIVAADYAGNEAVEGRDMAITLR